MTTHTPYAWLSGLAAASWQSQQATAPKPRLTLITTDSAPLKARKPKMKTSDHQAPSGVPVIPLHKHGAFSDISAAVSLLTLGADAMKGIGSMMQPGMDVHDEQLDNARRSDLSAIFLFFGAALREPAQTAYDAAERLERAALALEETQ